MFNQLTFLLGVIKASTETEPTQEPAVSPQAIGSSDTATNPSESKQDLSEPTVDTATNLSVPEQDSPAPTIDTDDEKNITLTIPKGFQLFFDNSVNLASLDVVIDKSYPTAFASLCSTTITKNNSGEFVIELTPDEKIDGTTENLTVSFSKHPTYLYYFHVIVNRTQSKVVSQYKTISGVKDIELLRVTQQEGVFYEVQAEFKMTLTLTRYIFGDLKCGESASPKTTEENELCGLGMSSVDSLEPGKDSNLTKTAIVDGKNLQSSEETPEKTKMSMPHLNNTTGPNFVSGQSSPVSKEISKEEISTAGRKVKSENSSILNPTVGQSEKEKVSEEKSKTDTSSPKNTGESQISKNSSKDSSKKSSKKSSKDSKKSSGNKHAILILVLICSVGIICTGLLIFRLNRKTDVESI